MAVATALMVTPAQATSASRSMSAEQASLPVPARGRVQAGVDLAAPGTHAAGDLIKVERRFGARRRTPGFGLLAILLFQRRLQRAQLIRIHRPDPIASAIIANCVDSKAGQSKGTMMPKQIRLNAFDMNCVAHQSPGLWTHPRDRTDRYNTLDYWVELARILKRGKFAALFLVDVLGIYDVYLGSSDAAIANAVQVPVNDPCC